MAMAEYRLCLERSRGRTPADADLISDHFLALFSKGTAADPDASKYPQAAEIRGVFDRVHAATLREQAEFPDADLDSPPAKPHSLCPTKLACLRYAPMHKWLHAGQVGLLRRLFGAGPVW